MHNHINCISLTSPHFELSNVFSNYLLERIQIVAFIWLFSTVYFQMSAQTACLWGWKVTLVAFIWFFSTVCFQMSPQSVCIGGCKVTLVTFVWLFSAVRFQMSPQISSPRGCIITLVAFVWLFSTVCLHVNPRITCLRGCTLTQIFNIWIHFYQSWKKSLRERKGNGPEHFNVPKVLVLSKKIVVEWKEKWKWNRTYLFEETCFLFFFVHLEHCMMMILIILGFGTIWT